MEPEIPSEPTGPATAPVNEAQPLGPSGTMCLGLPGNDAGNAGQNPGTEPPYRGLKWMFVGQQGLRAGWSALIWIVLLVTFLSALGRLFIRLHLVTIGVDTPSNAVFGELFQLLALIAATAIVATIERRSFFDFNLRGPKPAAHFLSGLVVGFAALSALVGSLAWGGWLHFGAVALTGGAVVKYAALWGVMFLMVGCLEEGTMRCYLQSTLTRGINFWWAAGAIGCICALLIFKVKANGGSGVHVIAEVKGNGVWGVFVIALLGVVPCLLLHLNKAPSAGFWQASWLTSTIFGALHTGNNGENWIGIFAAAFIGFVFCVSIWVTGSAWWAIGCHAAWDWAETYFYGTADSGMVAQGHLLNTSPAGNPFWSGGTDGPEGSVLIIPIVLLILAWLLVVYRRPRPEAPLAVSVEQESLAS